MRRGELAAASLDDLEEREDGSATLTFRRLKRGRPGHCLIGARLLALTRAVSRAEGDRRIVPLSASQIARRLKRAAEDAGIDGASSHSCPVGMVRDLVANGASIVQVQLAGGWRTSEMPALYARRETAAEGVVAKVFPDG